jgi:hypothetical protein
VPDADSTITVSGLLIFAATVLVLTRRLFAGSVLMLIAGSGGMAIFWDRWSERAGHQARITAFLTAPTPTATEIELFVTHLPLLMLGIALLVARQRRHSGGPYEDNTG